MALLARPRPDCSEAVYAAWILQPREGGTMAERSFFNGRTGRTEARLWRDGEGHWRVWDVETGGEGWQYQGTESGYRNALARYEARIAILSVKGKA